jgi:hypothetical protein
MAAKNLPVVGEAFLGSDPLVEKVIRISFGVDTTDGINDVIITDTSTLGTSTALSSINLLTVSDSKFMITDLGILVKTAFSAAADLGLGVSSSPTMFMGYTVGANAMVTGHSLATAGYNPVRWRDSSTSMVQINPAGSYINVDNALNLPFPQDSSDAIVLSAQETGISNGEADLYVFYVELP